MLVITDLDTYNLLSIDIARIVTNIEINTGTLSAKVYSFIFTISVIYTITPELQFYHNKKFHLYQIVKINK